VGGSDRRIPRTVRNGADRIPEWVRRPDLGGGFRGGRQKNGSSGRTRTYNPPVNSRMLCH
jgi:hypothetical protein